ncbi:MAG TPA: rhodanese-like domain-containing protein [Phycisphaerales bacterium]|nr:rhodanese-like domain-containing protein [Phycisphaerales bacterium]
MTFAGNIIARSLALVAIATGAAFVHWACDPIARLASPKGQPDAPGAGTAGQAGTTPIPDATDAQPGAAATDAAASEGAGAGPAVFDPTQLDTNIGTEAAFGLWQLGEVVFIDARPQDEYEAGHIPFAYLVPPASLDSGRLGDLMELGGVDPSQRTVVYCEGGTCDASELVALHLQDMGFTKLHIYVDGFPAWQAAGHEVETGPDQVLGDAP